MPFTDTVSGSWVSLGGSVYKYYVFLLSVIFMSYIFFKNYLMISHSELSTVPDIEDTKVNEIRFISYPQVVQSLRKTDMLSII